MRSPTVIPSGEAGSAEESFDTTPPAPHESCAKVRIWQKNEYLICLRPWMDLAKRDGLPAADPVGR